MGNQKENEGIKSPCLYCIHSQKGGVGKTAIAIAIAGFANVFQGKKTLLIDADLTGTSHFDILNLIEDKKPAKKSDKVVHYFNDLILANPMEFGGYTPFLDIEREESEKWGIRYFYRKVCLPNDCTITYIPSSPVFEDIQKVIPLISQEEHLQFFRHRLEDIIATAVMDEFEAIIIDHPPGLFGISKASLNMIFKQASYRIHKKETRLNKVLRAANNDHEITVKALLITTPEPNDYMALVPSFSWLLSDEINKNKNYKIRSSSDFSKALSVFFNLDNLDDAFYPEIDLVVNKGLKDPRNEINEILHCLKSLNSCDKRRKVDKKLIKFLDERATDIGAPVCKYVKEFNIKSILNTIILIKTDREEIGKEYNPLADWCKDIGAILGLYKKDEGRIIPENKNENT